MGAGVSDTARIAVLEVEVKHLKDDIDELKTQLASANAKLDQLVSAFNMGKGAWWSAMKIGGFIVMIMGALAWIVDHLPKVFR